MEPFHGAVCAGCDRDEARRRQVFEAAHPEWVIVWDPFYRVWRARHELPDGEDNLTRRELSDLLDALETR